MTDPADEDEQGPASPWLYLAGLCVTLSGLYAVSYGQDMLNFALATYAVAIAGYASSYLLRRLRVPYEALRLPLLVLVGLALFAWLSSGQAEGAADGRSILTDRSHAMQMLCVWIALLQPFAAATDAVVLFSCVPCMSLIALVSTTNPDTEVQYAFLVFVAAATFLMVHENFLRTRRAAVLGGGDDRRRSGGQLQLAIGCVACAFLLANLVAIPMHTFGRSLALANSWGPPGQFQARSTAALSGLLANDSQTLTIGTGPVAESDTPVMRVEAPEGRPWRGTTYDYYTGRAFENQLNNNPQSLLASDEASELSSMEKFHPADGLEDSGSFARYDIPENSLEPLFPSMNQGRTISADGNGAQWGPLSVLRCRQSSLRHREKRPERFVHKSGKRLYPVLVRHEFPLSREVCRAGGRFESTLRAASSSVEDIPILIARRYLQVAPAGAQENESLRQIAAKTTAGLKTNYDKAVAIRDYIAQTCKYNLQASAAPADVDRVEYFLTGSHQGYCDSFAASMAILCRYAGIPARVAAGYIAGEADGKGGFLVRQKHKHAWTELFFPGVGWVAFDATDGSEDISDHSQHKQTQRGDFVAWLFSHGMLPPLLLAAILSLSAYLLWSEVLPRIKRPQLAAQDGRPATNCAVVEAYLQACEYLDRRQLHRSRSATPAEFLAAVRMNLTATAPTAAGALAALTALHDRFRYSPEVATEAEAKEARELAAELRSVLSRVPARREPRPRRLKRPELI